MPRLTEETASKVLIVLFVASVFGQDDEFLKLKALGRPGHLGFLYDARLDRFLDFSVFKKPLPETFVKTRETPFSNVKTSMANTFAEKFNLFDINAELSASVLAGMLTIKGSAQFLMKKPKHSKEVTGAMLLDCKTVTESLELYYTDLENLFNTKLIESTEATHVVTGISWGANVVVTFKDTITDDKDEAKIAGSLEIEFKKLEGPFQVSGKASVDIHGKESNETSTFAISVQGDILLPDQTPKNHEEVTRLIQQVPQLISSTGGGRGVPLEFTLTPIGRLKSHLGSTSKKNNFAAKIDETILNSYITVFDIILNAEKLVNDNYELFKLNRICVLRDTWKKFMLLKRKFGTAKTSFTTAFQTALIKVRSSEADSTELSNLIEEIENNEFGPSNVEILLDEFQDDRSKVEQYQVIVNSPGRIQYFGATNNLEAALMANAYKVMYILFFKSEWIRNDVIEWENTIHTFLHILNKPHNTLLVVDCDFDIKKCIGLNRTVIMQIVNGKTIIGDVDGAIRLSKNNIKIIVNGLGTRAQVGELYDARTDTFLETSILKGSYSKSLIQSTVQNTTQTVTVSSEAIQDKLTAFQVTEEQRLSILAGSVPPFRTGNYLAMSTQTKSNQVFRQSILRTARTTDEMLDFNLEDFTNDLVQENLFLKNPTHFVTKVEHGYNAVFSVEASCTIKDPPGNFPTGPSTDICKTKFQQFKASFFQLVSKIGLTREQGSLLEDLQLLENSTLNYNIFVYSDTRGRDSTPLTFNDMDSFYQYLTSGFIPNNKDQNALAITYLLTPISDLQNIGVIAQPVIYGSLRSNNYTSLDVISILADIELAREQISQVSKKLRNKNYCITDKDYNLLKKVEHEFESSVGVFQNDYQNTVLKTKSGALSRDSLHTLIWQYKNDTLFDNGKVYKGLKQLLPAEKKLQFCKQFESTNVQYLGRENGSVYFDGIFESKPAIMIASFGAKNNTENELVEAANKVMYILFFKSEWIENDVTAWDNTLFTFLYILNKPHNTLLAADCDFNIRICNGLNRTVITQLVEGKTVLEDVDAAIRIPSDNFKLTLKGLGTRARIGELYDARTDTFLGTSILKSSHSKSLIQSTPQNNAQTIPISSESMEDKLSAFQVTEEQRFTILAGSVPPFRTGNYLAKSTQTRSKHVYRQSLLQTVRTNDEMLDSTLPDLTNDLVQQNLFLKETTHFVTKVEHGFNAVFSIESTCTTNDTQTDCFTSLNRDDFNTTFQQLKASFFQLIHKITLSQAQNQVLKEDLQFLETSTLDYKIVVYSDTQNRDSPPMTFNNKDSFYHFLTNELIPNHNEENAPAITYYLTPVSDLQEIGIIASRISYGGLTSDNYTSSDVISILEDIQLAREQIFQVSQKLRNNAHCITDQDLNLTKQIETEFESSVDVFQYNYKNTVLQIKSGNLSQDSLEKLISEYKSYTLFDNSKSLIRLQPLLPAEQKVRFCKTFDNTNVKYLGRESSSVYFRAIFEPKPVRVSMVYLLYFKPSWMIDNNDNSDEWQRTSQLFVGQLSTRVRNNSAVYYIVDCDFNHKHCANITRPSIFEYKNGLLTTTDYTETFEEEEVTLQGQLDALNARVTDKIYTVETQVTKNKNDIARVTDNISTVGTELTKNQNDIVALGTTLKAVNGTATQNQAQIHKSVAVEPKVTKNGNDIVALQTGLDAVKRTATENQIKIRFAHYGEKILAFIANATKLSHFGCGGTIQLPSEGESIVLDFNLTATTGATQRCLWTLHKTQYNKLVLFKVKLTLLCKQPTHILDDNTLTFTEWHYEGQINKALTTNRISSSSQDSFLLSNYWDFRGFLSFNSKRINSEAGFVLRVDVLDTYGYGGEWSSSSATLKQSFGSVPYRLPSSSADFSSIVINPQPVAKMTLTVDVDSHGRSTCHYKDSVDILEFGMDGIPKQLGRLCGRQSAISYETENPVAALFHWHGGYYGGGVKLTWK